ncbi:MAG: cell division protein CrgA [Actinomycetota bacterium]|jgi:small-conductance mechanosensitive channel
MPVSKSKRKRGGKRPKPPSVRTPPRKKRTSRWVPIVFFTAIGIGVALILTTYVFWNGDPIPLFSGLGLIGVAFAVATQWY